MHRRSWLRPGLVIALVVSVVAMAACTASETGTGDRRSDAVLRIGSTAEIDSLNPFVGSSRLSYATFRLTYPYLVEYDEALDPAPSLATGWSVSDDGRRWTFDLVSDAVWSDGEALDAEDVAWTVNTMLEFRRGGAANWAGVVADIVRVRAEDSSTVTVVYERPVADALARFQQLPILPEQVWGRAAQRGGAFADVDITPPLVSGGPFQVASYVAGQRLTMDANESFWGDQPAVQGIELSYLGTSDALVAAAERDEVDLLESVAATDVLPLRDAGFVVDRADSAFFYVFIMNSNPRKPENRELLDPRVREAFAAAIDLDALVESVWLGAATTGASMVPPATGEWSDSSLQPTPHDPERANQILDDLGLLRGSGDIRLAQDGTPMSYDVVVPVFPGSDRIFAMIRDWLAEIGVEVTANRVDDATAFELIGAPDYQYLDFDLALWNWVMPPDPDFALSVATCDSYGVWNDSGFCNARYDRLYRLQGSQLDPAERRATVHRMQRLLAVARPHVVLGYQDWMWAYSPEWSAFARTLQGPYNDLSARSMTRAAPR